MIENFKSRARVIDLLGRQQIADAPTATGELFKNALDAGATKVQVNFVSPENSNDIGYLYLRDNGLGMRLREDVIGKWLVLATESKFAKNVDDGWARFATKEQIKWMQTTYGEKGIGRLSVASLGRMTLLWSVWGMGVKKRGTLCAVHWHLFQHPRKLLDDLPIPCAEFDHIPTITEFSQLMAELRDATAIHDLLTDETWDRQLANELRADLAIPDAQIYDQLKLDFSMGTTFLCIRTCEDIPDLFRASIERTDELDVPPSSELKAANAFSSFWDPFHDSGDRKFELEVFVDGKPYRRGGQYRYWSPEDYKTCDHHIRVEVSDSGYAKGYIDDYQSDRKEYSRQLKKLLPGMKSPGNFLIDVGYVQGSQTTSFLPADLHRQMDLRLRYSGGFSIYKGGVHIQPYGAPDSDFAGFEQRRLKNAGRYYFSHLRMFGGVFLPSDNKQIREKAGREGFILNGASRALRYWIEDVFVDIADRYLGRKADREDKRKIKAAKLAAAARKRIAEEKSSYLKSVRYARGWLNDLKAKIKEAVLRSRACLSSASNDPSKERLAACDDALSLLQQRLSELQSSVSDPPDGVVILGDTWDVVSDYISDRGVQITNLQSEISRQSQQLQVIMSRVRPMQERERRYVNRLAEADARVRDQVTKLIEGACKSVDELSPRLLNLAEKEIADLKVVRDSVLSGLTPKKVADDETGAASVLFEKAIQQELDELESYVLPRIRTLCSNLQHLTDWESGIFVLSDQTRELQVLREQHSHLITAAQLGLVFETATHEYEKHVECVRDAIVWFEKHIDGTASGKLQALKDSFEIIDERIRLMDPLIRRRNLRSSSIVGSEIEDFLCRRFASELAVVKGLFTDAFRKTKWDNLNRPVFLGALHNLFINSLYWARQGSLTPSVRFSVSANGGIVISDSGPGVNKIDARYIFEPGFSRRPGGQGLGLYIARESLKEIGYEISLLESAELGALSGANFVIDKLR